MIHGRHRSGSVLVVTIFLALGLVGVALLVADVGNGVATSQRNQTLADVTAMSAVRMRVEALETIAARWSEFGRFFGPVRSDGSIGLASANTATVAQKALELKKALPGYQGRATAVIKVIAEANSMAREDVNVLSNAGSQIGLTAEKLRAVDEFGRVTTIDGGWLRRLWAPTELLSDPPESAMFLVTRPVRTFNGDDWTIPRRANAAVRWDVDKKNTDVAARGNGGYPRNFSDAVDNGSLKPNRYAVFAARSRP